jgi:HlyD family secretion protein
MAVRESYATWKATKETDGYDARTFEVRAVPSESVAGLRPGMTVLFVK